MTAFKKLGLSSFLIKALENQKYKEPYPIQKEAIPAILKGKDILGIAKTGSGKTASFVLPILMNQQGKTKETSLNRHINVLVLVPTRELAIQVKEVFQTFANVLPEKVKCLAVFGGVAINPQMKSLNNVNILVATPGRLLELVDSNAVNLSKTETLVLDEADKMLNLGFKDEMDRIFSFLPKKRQNLLFSATLSDKIEEINQFILNNPQIIKIESKDENNLDLIDQIAYFVPEENKGPLLRYLIKEEDLKQVLVFVSSTKKADNVATKLRKNWVTAAAIHSNKSQNSRTEALRRFKTSVFNVLVATDLISRGIDIEYLPVVVNYELPRSPKDYVHRIGRTGRAESHGKAITFVTPDDMQHFKLIQKKMGKKVEIIDSEKFDLQGY